MPKRLAAALLVALGALAASACKGPTDPSDNTVESFSGTIQPAGEPKIHEYTVANTGEITITLMALTPGGTAAIGIGYGQLAAAGNCAIVQNRTVNSSSVGRTVMLDQIYIKGQYCLIVFDSALLPLTVAQNYTVEVSHP